LSRIALPKDIFDMLKEKKHVDKNIILGIRPEYIYDQPETIEANATGKVKLKVDVAELLGAETLIYAKIHGQNLIARVDARTDIHMGDDIVLALDMKKAHFFDPETELRITKD